MTDTTTEIRPEHFEFNAGLRWLILVSPWIMVALALLFALVPLVPASNHASAIAFFDWFGKGMAIFLGIVAGLCFALVRYLPQTAISVDEEGLWPTIKGKHTALVKWANVNRLRENLSKQQLQLLDVSGEVVARIQYHLQDYPRLRDVILERVNLVPASHAIVGVYQAPIGYHIFMVGLIIGFALLGWAVSQYIHAVIGYCSAMIFVALLGWEYWRMPFRLRITPTQLEIDRPFRRQIVLKEHVDSITIDEDHVRNMYAAKPMLNLVDGSKPIDLKSIGLPATELYQILHQWTL